MYGSFTASGANEAVASFEGCEPHTALFGGSILLHRVDGSWSMVRYTPALITTACRTYRLKTGRDLLLCERYDGHMDGASTGISVCEFPAGRNPACPGVFGVINTAQACGPTAVSGFIDKLALHDMNSDGMPDLTLWITVVQSTSQNTGGTCLGGPTQSTVQNYKMDFLFQPASDGFIPAPRSSAQVERLRALFHNAREEAYKVTVSRYSKH
jgi:hypothetical protein